MSRRSSSGVVIYATQHARHRLTADRRQNEQKPYNFRQNVYRLMLSKINESTCTSEENSSEISKSNPFGTDCELRQRFVENVGYIPRLLLENGENDGWRDPLKYCHVICKCLRLKRSKCNRILITSVLAITLLQICCEAKT